MSYNGCLGRSTRMGYGETSPGLSPSPGICKQGTFQARSAIFAILRCLAVISFDNLSSQFQVHMNFQLPQYRATRNTTICHTIIYLRRKGNPCLARSSTIAKKGRLSGGTTSSSGLVCLKACLSVFRQIIRLSKKMPFSP